MIDNDGTRIRNARGLYPSNDCCALGLGYPKQSLRAGTVTQLGEMRGLIGRRTPPGTENGAHEPPNLFDDLGDLMPVVIE